MNTFEDSLDAALLGVQDRLADFAEHIMLNVKGRLETLLFGFDRGATAALALAYARLIWR